METMTPAEKLFTEFWEWRLQQTPEFATFTGDKRYNGRLEAWTETRFEEDNQTCRHFLERAGALLERAGGEEERLNLQFLMSELGIFVAGHQHGGYFFPLNYMGRRERQHSRHRLRGAGGERLQVHHPQVHHESGQPLLPPGRPVQVQP